MRPKHMVEGSNPFGNVFYNIWGISSVWEEHLPCKQRVIGSSPICSTRNMKRDSSVEVTRHIWDVESRFESDYFDYADVAKTADALVSKTSGLSIRVQIPSSVLTECGSVWSERLVWVQEVAGSNPVIPIAG